MDNAAIRTLTRIQQFADWAVDLTLDTVPERVVERARLQAMNTVAGGLARSTAPGGARGDVPGDDKCEVLEAQIAANELEGRLGAALFLGPLSGQFWSSIHCAG